MANFYSVDAYGTLTPNVLRSSQLKLSRPEKHQYSTDEETDSHGQPPIPVDADTEDNIQKFTISHSSNKTQRDDVEECEMSSDYSLWPQVFLSHSGKQKNLARDLFKQINRESEDPQSLPKGKVFSLRIFEAAMNCRVAVVVSSEESISSECSMEELCAFVKAKNTSIPSLKILFLFFGMSPYSLDQKLQKKDFLPRSPKRPIDFNEWIEALEALRPINGVNYTEAEGEVAYIEKIVHHIRHLLLPNLKYEESDVQGKERLYQELAKLFDKIPCRKNEVRVGDLQELGRDDSIQQLKHALRNLCDASESLVNSVTSFQDGGRLLKDMMYGKEVFLAVDNISDLSESIKEA